MGVCTWAYYRRNLVPSQVEQDVQEILKLVSVGDDSKTTKRPTRFNRKRWRRVTLTAKVVRALKLKFQYIENPKPVDKIAVRRYAVDCMLEMKDITHADIERVWPVASELYWARTQSEIYAAQVARSATKYNSIAEANRSYFGGVGMLLRGWLRPASSD